MKQMKLKHHSRIILPVAITLLLSLAVQAHEASQDKSEGEAKPKVELKLSTITPVLCIGSPLVLDVELTNISQEALKFHRVQLWTQFSYNYTAADGSGRGGGVGFNPGSRGEETLLQPGMTYRSRYEFSLMFDFFDEAGTYTLKTNFDSVFSNDVKFEIYDCGKPQEVKEQR